ncbi:sodium:solute symporter [Synergistales bacterium]|nr:sodium:solute symporter [Synergistales bacterium]GHV53527.1 sodium:solute symporter [Synergistales bacterium]
MGIWHYIGAALVLILITVVGMRAGKNVSSADDFNSASHKAGAGVVMGSIAGTLVGGASTVGTAQLAFSYGLSAWWFTLGGGLACILLFLFFAKPLYESGFQTMPRILAHEFGQPSGMAATLLTSAGSLLSIISQFLSGIALIMTASALGSFAAAALITALMLVYVVFGGVWGAGRVGIAKTALLCASVAVCGLIAVNTQGGLSAFRSLLPADRYFNFFARGYLTDGGAALSIIVGVLTTQSYIQAVISARTLRLSRAGVLASAVIIPFVGFAGILVGMYMKLNYPDIAPASALPYFIMRHLPPLAAGAALATLLITVVGTGAGVALGLSSMIYNDIYKVFWGKAGGLFVSRLIIVIILVGSALLSSGNIGSLILGWSFLSMGLRGAVAFGPICAALFLRGMVPGKFALCSMIAGPAVVIISKIFIPGMDPLLPGVAANLAVICAGLAKKRLGNIS